MSVNVPSLAAVLNQVDESGLSTWIGGFFALESASDGDVQRDNYRYLWLLIRVVLTPLLG